MPLRPWNLVHAPDSTVRMSGASTELLFRSAPPRWLGREDTPLAFSAPTALGRVALAGLDGTVQAQSAASAGLDLVRELFVADDGRTVAVRLAVTNRGEGALRLDTLTPLVVDSAAGLQIAGGGADWQVVRMSRQKNDVPGCFRPTARDGDWQQARIDGAEFRAGMGSTSSERIAAGRDPDSIPSDPGVCIRNGTAPEAPALLLAVLGQTEHLSRVVLAMDPEANCLRDLRVICEFDEVLVAPGTTRQTHWIVLREDRDVQALWTWHAERIAELLHVPHPKPAPTVFCSWYFYGRDLLESDVHENLAELQRRPVPLDTFLLDNGWMDNFGDWNHHPVRFPSGMTAVARAIRDAGFAPGIWTCPFVLSPRSAVVARFPRLVLRNADGEPCTFPYREPEFSEDLYVLDPTAPEAEEYLRGVFGRLAAWGYLVHKLDFLRAVIVPLRPRFHDATANRAQAYRRGMEAIRDAVGPEGYILACGGLFEGSAGLVDGNRIGSDVKGRWYEPDGKPGHLVRIKQNLFRNHTNRLWHTDADALQLRRRTEPFRGESGYAHLSAGRFTDDEAFACVVNQYLGGGLVCVSERLVELDEDRRRLLRHVVPPCAPPARVLDLERPGCPTLFLTHVTPRASGLAPWWTITICNWEDASVERDVCLGLLKATGKLAVFEFATQRWLGVHPADGRLAVAIPAHGARVLRVAAWDGQSPLLLGTDCHLTGGAAEFASFALDGEQVAGTLDTPWNLPVTTSVGFPVDGTLRWASFTLTGPGDFALATCACHTPHDAPAASTAPER